MEPGSPGGPPFGGPRAWPGGPPLGVIPLLEEARRAGIDPFPIRWPSAGEEAAEARRVAMMNVIAEAMERLQAAGGLGLQPRSYEKTEVESRVPWYRSARHQVVRVPMEPAWPVGEYAWRTARFDGAIMVLETGLTPNHEIVPLHEVNALGMGPIYTGSTGLGIPNRVLDATWRGGGLITWDQVAAAMDAHVARYLPA